MILHTDFGLIWTTPWPDEKDLFLKVDNRENRKFSYENPTFLLGQLYQKFFLFYTLITVVILHSTFDLIWTTPWPDEEDLFLKFAKIGDSRNSQNSVWKPNFFARKAIPKILFVLHSNYSCYTPYQVWFDLNSSLIRWKRPIFKIRKNLRFAKFAKFRMKTQLFC